MGKAQKCPHCNLKTMYRASVKNALQPLIGEVKSGGNLVGIPGAIAGAVATPFRIGRLFYNFEKGITSSCVQECHSCGKYAYKCRGCKKMMPVSSCPGAGYKVKCPECSTDNYMDYD